MRIVCHKTTALAVGGRRLWSPSRFRFFSVGVHHHGCFRLFRLMFSMGIVHWTIILVFRDKCFSMIRFQLRSLVAAAAMVLLLLSSRCYHQRDAASPVESSPCKLRAVKLARDLRRPSSCWHIRTALFELRSSKGVF